MDIDQLSAEEIARRLAIVRRHSPDNPYPSTIFTEPPEPAAVLIPFIIREGRWNLLFIRRSENHNDRHSGQVAFPGGRSDADDRDAVSTALREAREEIGVDSQNIEILGALNDHITITNYRVTPVVGVLTRPFTPRLAAQEVSRAFTIPLEWLAEPANHEIRERDLPPPHGAISVIYFREYDREVLWGASARITLHLIKALGLL